MPAPQLRVLTCGGLDPTAGAGITADARMIQLRGAVPLTVATCLTVQNRTRFESVHPVDAALVRRSLHAVVEDGPVHAVKLGLMPDSHTLQAVVEVLALSLAEVPLVVDPVLSSTASGLRSDPALVEIYRQMLPMITMLTPNQNELARLAPQGVQQLLGSGCGGVLVTNGDSREEQVTDRLYRLEGMSEFVHPRLEVGRVHGTGCALATTIAVHLARGEDMEQAAAQAVRIVARCLEATVPGPDGEPVPLNLI
jgi:hydroxymethylpyrimidine/phosphomethylpyrimidine kinase